MGFLSSLLTELQPFTEGLTKQSTTFLVVAGLLSLCTTATILNVIQQLFFADPNVPPVVFHIFPFFGSTIIYGIDPYKFFFGCQEKVLAFCSQLRYISRLLIRSHFLFLSSMGIFSPLSCLAGK